MKYSIRPEVYEQSVKRKIIDKLDMDGYNNTNDIFQTISKLFVFDIYLKYTRWKQFLPEHSALFMSGVENYFMCRTMRTLCGWI